jgi:ferredoxin--NADP+ reductase
MSRQLRVERIIDLTESTYILRLEKQDISFESGQYLLIGSKNDVSMREYSIYSGPTDPFIDVLIKEISSGEVSRALRRVKPGRSVYVQGPFGFFTMEEQKRTSSHVFIATGTGISPFHSFVKTWPDLDYLLLHGVRKKEECDESKTFEEDRYISCLSRESGGKFESRVTEYLKNSQIDTEASYWLCGNSEMIYDAYDILQTKGVSPEQLHAEVYF